MNWQKGCTPSINNVKHTWHSNAQRLYTVLPFSESTVTLSIGWFKTWNCCNGAKRRNLCAIVLLKFYFQTRIAANHTLERFKSWSENKYFFARCSDFGVSRLVMKRKKKLQRTLTCQTNLQNKTTNKQNKNQREPTKIIWSAQANNAKQQIHKEVSTANKHF